MSPSTPTRPVGQPPKIKDANLRVFERCIAEGMTIHASLEKADIKPRTYYDYIDRHPEYAQTIGKLKDNIADVAEATIARHLQGTPTDAVAIERQIELAKWVLKRRKSGEYGDNAGLPAPSAPQLGAGKGGVNFNFGQQTLVNAEELTDGELQRLARGEDIRKVLGDRVIANADK